MKECLKQWFLHLNSICRKTTQFRFRILSTCKISITSDAPFLKGKPEKLPHQKGEKVKKEKTGELAEEKGKGKPRIMLKEDPKQP